MAAQVVKEVCMADVPDSDNPYAAPKSHDISEPDWAQRIWVDGEFLVVSDGVKLPQRCVFTNEPVDEPPLVQTLKWAPSFRPVISETKIRVTYAVNRRRQKRRRLNRHIVASLQALAAVLLYAATGNPFPSTVVVVTGVLIFLEERPFLVVSKSKNDRFWLRGCGPEFLASCREEFGPKHQPIS